MARRKTEEYYDQKRKERNERVAFERKLRLAYESRVDAQTQTESIDGQIGEGEDNRAEQAAEDALSLSDEIPLLEIEEEMASLTSRTKKEKKKKDKKDKKYKKKKNKKDRKNCKDNEETKGSGRKRRRDGDEEEGGRTRRFWGSVWSGST